MESGWRVDGVDEWMTISSKRTKAFASGFFWDLAWDHSGTRVLGKVVVHIFIAGVIKTGRYLVLGVYMYLSMG